MRANGPQILLLAISLTLQTRALAADPPYPPSPVFEGVTFAPPSEITPLPPTGDTASATSRLEIDNRVYIWIPGKGNSQLAWSDDRGANWTLAPWRLATSFGYPVFLNFGKDNATAHGEYVYIYSHDRHSANEPADRMVLARVRKDRIARREAYEFFGAVEDNRPYWVQNIEERTAVFNALGRCYHSSISYHAPSKRYLWVQILPTRDPQTAGFGIYDAPEPWGPWTTVFYTEKWDAPVSDNALLPVQSMSPDGRSAEFHFSTAAGFSKRRIEFRRKPQ